MKFGNLALAGALVGTSAAQTVMGNPSNSTTVPEKTFAKLAATNTAHPVNPRQYGNNAQGGDCNGFGSGETGNNNVNVCVAGKTTISVKDGTTVINGKTQGVTQSSGSALPTTMSSGANRSKQNFLQNLSRFMFA